MSRTVLCEWSIGPWNHLHYRFEPGYHLETEYGWLDQLRFANDEPRLHIVRLTRAEEGLASLGNGIWIEADPTIRWAYSASRDGKTTRVGDLSLFPIPGSEEDRMDWLFG